jgi:opacity protein-like surface antigen
VGRIGYVFSSFLAYAKVGFEGRSKINTFGTAGSLSRDGILLGGGGDYAITQNVFLRAEYTYNFGSRKKFAEDGGSTLNIRTPTKTILIGAGYKF